MTQGHILTQTFGFVNASSLEPHGEPVDVPAEAMDYGYMMVPCNDGCYGTGLFELPDGDKIQCNNCKGTGGVWINVN